MDPAKLKVVELRAELSKRSLDTKGNKPVLVKRLREALESESGDAIPDTSIADTSTEDCNTSQESPESKEPDREKTPDRSPTPPSVSPSPPPPKSRSRTRRTSDRTESKREEPVVTVESTIPEEMDIATVEEKIETVDAPPPPEAQVAETQPAEAQPEAEQPSEEPFKNGQSHEEQLKQDIAQEPSEKMEVDEETRQDEQQNEDAAEPEPEKEPRSNRKSRWGSMIESTEAVAPDSGGQVSESNDSTPSGDAAVSTEPRGEKRRHSSPYTERSQRKRSRSPVKEDEPEIDHENVQLSWFDSDLNLQVNKESFTSAEPMHSDGFGYMWAGVRSSHGIKNGKVWYEVKLLDNCEWKEAPKKDDREKEKDRGRDRERRDHKSEEKSRKEDRTDMELDEDKSKEDDSKINEDKVAEVETDATAAEVKNDDEIKTEENKEETEDKLVVVKLEDKSENKPEIKSEHKSDDESEDKSEDKSEEKSEDKSEDKSEHKLEDKSEDKPEDKSEDKSDKSEDKSDKLKDKSDKLKDKSEVKSDDKSEDNSEDKIENISEDKLEEPEKKIDAITEIIHILRVGWSLPNTELQLGEQKNSFAYDSEGFTVTNSEFTEFGVKFASGDVVGTFLDMESDPVTISYTVNGELQPTAFTIPRSELPEYASMFPHILTRNIKFEVNFGQNEEVWFQPPAEFSDYKLLKEIEEKVNGVSRPGARQDCEVIMMVGLPCSGKTNWVNNHVQNNPEKRYSVLGLTNILDKMKQQGKPKKENYKGSMTVLMDKCTRCLSKLVDLASTRRRNYILDQTNLFSSAQRRKLRPFDGFRRQAVVIVVTDDEQSSREKSRQQADGKDVPDSAVLEMKANMCLPAACDWLDEVTFAELEETKAKEIVQKYNKQGREAGYGPNYTAKQHHSNNQRNNRRGQWSNNNRNNKRDSSRENRNRWGGSGSGGSHRQNNWGGGNRGSSGGGGWGGRHDSRNHHHGGGGGGGSSGGGYRSSSDRQMMRGNGGGYNRNPSRDESSRGGYNRNRNQPHNRSAGNKASWGGQGGGSWSSQGGNWGGQGSGWGSHQSGQGSGSGSGSGSWGNWGQYGGSQGGGQQWKGGYNTQYQQQYPQGYAGQYGGQYANWNYYGQYPQSWNTQGQGSGSGTGDNVGNSSQYNQYSQQQQAAWAQYAQGGYGYGQTQAAPQGGSTTAGSNNASSGGTNSTQQSASK